MADDEQKQSAAQRRQVKFSGLVNRGVIPPLSTAEGKDFVSEVNEGANNLETSQSLPNKTTTDGTEYRKIPLNLIDDSPYQPRDLYDQEEIDSLGHSFAAAGQEEKITVRRKANGRYELIKGHRRTRAARSIGWEEIDAEIVIKDDREAKLSAMVSNEGRVDLTDYERAKMYQETINDGYAKTQTDLAHIFSAKQGHVSMRMAMLKLPQRFTDMLDKNPDLFSATTAGTIAGLLKDYPAEIDLVESAVKRLHEGASQNSIKSWFEQMHKAKHKDVTKKDQPVVTDPSGREMFKLKVSNREITVSIKAHEMDAKEIEELVMTTLRNRVNPTTL